MPGIFRIAPTPSGFIHKGNIFNFILTWLLARVNHGKILLRIDDLDALRARSEYVEDIFRSLKKLGMDWDLGPTGPEDFYRNWSQKWRVLMYEKSLSDLCRSAVVFACECSRRDLVESTIYPGTCTYLGIPMETPNMAWRLKVPRDSKVVFTDANLGNMEVALGVDCGDFVVRRRDGIHAYQLASVVDDLHFGVTHIVRGKDLVLSTAMQHYLAEKLGYKKFSEITFWHHNLLSDLSGEKLSKSAGAEKKPYEVNPHVFADFAKWMCWDLEAVSLTELFELAKSRLKIPN